MTSDLLTACPGHPLSLHADDLVHAHTSALATPPRLPGPPLACASLGYRLIPQLSLGTRSALSRPAKQCAHVSVPTGGDSPQTLPGRAARWIGANLPTLDTNKTSYSTLEHAKSLDERAPRCHAGTTMTIFITHVFFYRSGMAELITNTAKATHTHSRRVSSTRTVCIDSGHGHSLPRGG